MNKPGWGFVALFSVVSAFAGGVIGFLVGVGTSAFGQEVFDEVSMIEERAEIENPVTLNQSLYTLQYPGNWSIDYQREDYDAEHFFYIDTPGGSYIEVTVEEFGSDPQESLDEKLEWYEEYFNYPEYSDITRYGSYTGSGKIVKCRGLGYGETYRFFAYSDGNKTFTVIEYIYDMDSDLCKPGFDLIERTLKIK